MEEIMNDKWISIDEAAEYLGLKRSLFAAGFEMEKKVCLLKKLENSGSLKYLNLMNGLKAVKALTDSMKIS